MYETNDKEINLEKMQVGTESELQEIPDQSSNVSIVSESKKQENQQLVVKLTGNLQYDIVRLMSLKPEHYQFSFTGLKRILGNVHQQQLVNTIDRLVDDSIVLKSQDGYELATKMVKSPVLSPTWSETFVGKKLYPTPLSVKNIFKSLYGKWFGKNRFLGGVIDPKLDEAFLEWINLTDQKSQTRLEIKPYEIVARFNNVGSFERDKAINVFSDTLNDFNNPIMFENETTAYINN
jgi:hypothetical protein